MDYHISKPSVILSQYIKQYWAIDNCLPNGGIHTQRIVPSGLMEITFYLGDLPTSTESNKNINANSILSGQQKGFHDLLVSGKLSLFSVTLQPCAATLFFDIPSNEFFNRNIPLAYLVKDKIAELESRMFEPVTFDQKVQIIESFLIQQLRNTGKEYELNRMMKSVALINKAKGIIDIETLSSSACLSRKQYERMFAAYIGSSPKQFLRTVRFQNTLRVKQKNKNIQLTELAYTCGYYDQSHMISDYKMMSGISPSQYFSCCEPYSDYFQ